MALLESMTQRNKLYLDLSTQEILSGPICSFVFSHGISKKNIYHHTCLNLYKRGVH